MLFSFCLGVDEVGRQSRQRFTELFGSDILVKLLLHKGTNNGLLKGVVVRQEKRSGPTFL